MKLEFICLQLALIGLLFEASLVSALNFTSTRFTREVESCVRPLNNIRSQCQLVQAQTGKKKPEVPLICSAWKLVPDPNRLEVYSPNQLYKVYCTSFSTEFPTEMEISISSYGKIPKSHGLVSDAHRSNCGQPNEIVTFSKLASSTTQEIYFSSIFQFKFECPEACLEIQIVNKDTQELVACRSGCFPIDGPPVGS